VCHLICSTLAPTSTRQFRKVGHFSGSFVRDSLSSPGNQSQSANTLANAIAEKRITNLQQRRREATSVEEKGGTAGDEGNGPARVPVCSVKWRSNIFVNKMSQGYESSRSSYPAQ
jgi:hypothetical protein